MGLILLVGLVVKNGIVMLDYAHRLHAEGQPFVDAVAHAARVRLRPILMTTLCTLFGLLPLALGLGAGAELQKPLALAVDRRPRPLHPGDAVRGALGVRGAAPERRPRRMKLLLIEDSPRLRSALEKGLRKAGYAVDLAKDGREGLWLATENDYDVIVLDLMLPGSTA